MGYPSSYPRASVGTTPNTVNRVESATERLQPRGPDLLFTRMDWTFWTVVAVAVFVAWIYLTSRGQIGEKEALELLRAGAKVVDVRSVREYSQEHLAGVINIPLGSLSDSLPALIPDKESVVLLHCLSGTRSGIARQRLKSLGYANAHNLGSFQRAKTILTKLDRP